MNEIATTPLFTAAQLARALGKSKRAVSLALSDVPATRLPVRGGQADAWPLSALQPAWRVQLAADAQRRGCRDAAHLLQSLIKPWQPEDRNGRVVPVDEIDRPFIERAVQLRDALKLPLARQHELEPEQLREFGLEECERVCRSAAERHLRKTIGPKQWDRLFDRTVQRDRGAEDWERLDIYLDDDAFARPMPKPSRDKARFSHHELDAVIDNLENKTCPTAEDRAWLFHETFHHYEALAAAHPSPPDQRTIKASLRDYLSNILPGAFRNGRNLKREFDRKLHRWRKGGPTIEALRDQRPLKSGNHRRRDFSEDEKKIRDLAVALDGNESLAHQTLRERGELSEAFCAYYPFDPRRKKSDVPRAVRDNITPAVEFTKPLRLSQRALTLAGPWTDRDWSGELPGDWFTADDVTWNHLFKVRTATGWDVMRGECLLMTDAKSDYPIVPLLIAGHYNSEHIVRLITRAHDLIGLPRKGFILERGVWSGKLVKAVGAGRVPLGKTLKAFASAKPDLVIHRTYTPRGKPIEGVFHHLQDRMRCIFGFVGFNEQVEKREDIQRLIARARRGDEEAQAQFLTQDAWMEKIVSVLDEFRHCPGNGKRLEGASPSEAWNAALRDHPLPKLSDDTRYLLATHCVEACLKNEGIVLTIRGHRRCYSNQHTGQWLARGVSSVLAHYNVEQPELLTVSDFNRTQFFAVKAHSLPAMSATREQLAEVAAAKRAHLAPARAIFGHIKHNVVSNITRDNGHDDAAKELGRFHNDAIARHGAEQSIEEREIASLRRRARKLGLSIETSLGDPRQRAALKMELDGIELERNSAPPAQ